MTVNKRLTWNEMMKVPPEKLNEYSLVPVRIYENTEDIFYDLAIFIMDLIKENNAKGKPTRIGWPVGPKKHE
jgi:hypothetical protein